jgi:hypothetical protein
MAKMPTPLNEPSGASCETCGGIAEGIPLRTAQHRCVCRPEAAPPRATTPEPMTEEDREWSRLHHVINMAGDHATLNGYRTLHDDVPKARAFVDRLRASIAAPPRATTPEPLPGIPPADYLDRFVRELCEAETGSVVGRLDARVKLKQAARIIQALRAPLAAPAPATTPELMTLERVRAMLPELYEFGEPQDSTISVASVVEFLLARSAPLAAPAPESGALTADTPESLMLQHDYTSWPELLNDAKLGYAVRTASPPAESWTRIGAQIGAQVDEVGIGEFAHGVGIERGDRAKAAAGTRQAKAARAELERLIAALTERATRAETALESIATVYPADKFAPTPQRDWVKVGDSCVSPAGMRGKVLRVSAPQTGLPSATVQWENGHTGRLTITNLRRARGNDA